MRNRFVEPALLATRRDKLVRRALGRARVRMQRRHPKLYVSKPGLEAGCVNFVSSVDMYATGLFNMAD